MVVLKGRQYTSTEAVLIATTWTLLGKRAAHVMWVFPSAYRYRHGQVNLEEHTL